MTAEKIEAFWQDATFEDVAEIANTRKPITARARDQDNEVWREVLLAGWQLRRLSDVRWVDSHGVTWNQCQVYREPSYWANKPDPGPGWRLLEKLPDEERKEHDEWWDGTCWSVSVRFASGPQSEGIWYRRRIEPVEPEPKHYTLRVGDSVETPSGDRMKCVEPGVEQRHYKLRVTDTVGTPNGQTITITAKGFEVTQ